MGLQMLIFSLSFHAFCIPLTLRCKGSEEKQEACNGSAGFCTSSFLSPLSSSCRVNSSCQYGDSSSHLLIPGLKESMELPGSSQNLQFNRTLTLSSCKSAVPWEPGRVQSCGDRKDKDAEEVILDVMISGVISLPPVSSQAHMFFLLGISCYQEV